MIYLIDEPLHDDSHSKYILDIISKHTSVEVKLIELPAQPTYGQLYRMVLDLFNVVSPSDIVLCTWAVDGDIKLDEIFNDLSELCFVVAAAGNYNVNIKDYSPARAERVTTVACLNKSGLKAALSNWSEDKELVWIPGTNYNVGWKNSSGTSVSAAVYAALLAESISGQQSLDELITAYTESVYSEIQRNQ